MIGVVQSWALFGGNVCFGVQALNGGAGAMVMWGLVQLFYGSMYMMLLKHLAYGRIINMGHCMGGALFGESKW